jgi:hypothetical protein
MIFGDESVLGVCRYHYNVEFQFFRHGSDEQLSRRQNLKPGKQISDDTNVRYGGIISLDQRGKRVRDDQILRARQCLGTALSVIRTKTILLLLQNSR